MAWGHKNHVTDSLQRQDEGWGVGVGGEGWGE